MPLSTMPGRCPGRETLGAPERQHLPRRGHQDALHLRRTQQAFCGGRFDRALAFDVQVLVRNDVPANVQSLGTNGRRPVVVGGCWAASRGRWRRCPRVPGRGRAWGTLSGWSPGVRSAAPPAQPHGLPLDRRGDQRGPFGGDDAIRTTSSTVSAVATRRQARILLPGQTERRHRAASLGRHPSHTLDSPNTPTRRVSSRTFEYESRPTRKRSLISGMSRRALATRTCSRATVAFIEQAQAR